MIRKREMIRMIIYQLWMASLSHSSELAISTSGCIVSNLSHALHAPLE